jgi:hypothetical protein
MRIFVNHLCRISKLQNKLSFSIDFFLYRIFSEGGNFSREEIEIYRKKLEKTAGQIDKGETVILKEMEKLEKKQLEEATKIINQFQER